MKLPRALTLLALTLLALASLSGACSSSSDGGSSDAKSCTSAPHAQGEIYPIRYEADLTHYPECAPRCGAARVSGGPFHPIEALPAGSCAQEPTCAMAVQYFCGCPTTTGPVHGFRCDCLGGEWQCVLAQPGAAACAPGCTDAGVDGG